MNADHLTRLHDLASFVLAQEDLTAGLGELAQHAATANGGAACSIMLLSEGDSAAPRLKLWASTEKLPASAWSATQGVGEAIAGRVLLAGQPLLIKDIQQSEFAALAHRHSKSGSSFMCVPVNVAGRMIGVINVTNRTGMPPFDESDLMLAQITATLVGKSIQVERLQLLVRSRVAQIALAREQQQVAARIAEGVVPPANIAKMLAKSFYKDLAAAGFEPGQIIDAASEIIAQISTSVGRHRNRIHRPKN